MWPFIQLMWLGAFLYLLPIVLLGLLIWYVDFDPESDNATSNPGSALFLIIAGLAGMILFTDIPVVQWVRAHPFEILIGSLAYVVAGPIWALAHWTLFFVPARVEVYESTRDQRKADYAKILERGTPDKSYEDWLSFWHNMPPNPMKFKSRILAWMMYWPADLLVVLCSKAIRRLYNYLFGLIVGVFHSMVRRQFSKFDEFK